MANCSAQNGLGLIRTLTTAVAATCAHTQFFQGRNTRSRMLTDVAVSYRIADTDKHGLNIIRMRMIVNK